MDTAKLFKAIQLVVAEEVKKQIGGMKDQIRKEILAEMKSTPKSTKTTLKDVVNETDDPFELAQKILSSDRKSQETRQFTKNPLINDILNETVVRPNFSKDDGGWGTLPTSRVFGGGADSQNSVPKTGIDSIDAAIARSAKVLAASKDKKR